MKPISLTLLALSFALLSANAHAKFDHSHAKWDSWLRTFVTKNGPVSTVNYKAAKAKPELLQPYLKEIAAVTQVEFSQFTEVEKLAFLINTYNANTVSLIVDNYPVKSIKDLGSLFKSPWKKKFFKLFGEEQSLDGIEHEMIRKMFNEPRIHFSVVCASKGCPALRNEAFLSATLEKQFSDSAAGFLNDPSRNLYDAKENKLSLSMIFKWYGDDFTKKFGSVQTFVAGVLAKVEAEKASMDKAEIAFLDYDWSLNETP